MPRSFCNGDEMKTVRIDLADLPKENPVIGKRGENLCTNVIFDVSSMFAEWPYGTVTILYWRPDKKAKFLCVQTKENEITWQPTSADLKYPGTGFVEVRMYQDDILEKRAPIFLEIEKAPVKNVHFEDDDDDDDWVKEFLDTIGTIKTEQEDNDRDIDELRAMIEGYEHYGLREITNMDLEELLK